MQQNAVRARTRSRREKRWLFVFAMLCLLTSLVARFWPREPLLLESAVRVADFVGESDYAHVFWLSSRDCLLITTPGHYASIEEAAKDPSLDHVWWAEQINVQTGRSFPVVWLDKAFRQGEGDPTRFMTSPDGKWLLWYSVQTGDGFGVSVVARTDGSQVYTQDTDGHSDVYWLNNTHWAEDKRTYFDEHDNYVGDHRRLVVYNVEKPREAHFIREHSPQEQQVQAQIEAHNPHRFTTESDEHEDLELKRSEIAELLPGHQKIKPLCVYRTTPPKGATLEKSFVSASGKLTACFGTREWTQPFSRFLHRLVPSFRVKTQKREVLWVGRLGGKEWREIGYVPLAADQEASDISELQWLPGGKRLSFVYRNALYTVPAE